MLLHQAPAAPALFSSLAAGQAQSTGEGAAGPGEYTASAICTGRIADMVPSITAVDDEEGQQRRDACDLKSLPKGQGDLAVRAARPRSTAGRASDLGEMLDPLRATLTAAEA